MVWREGRDAYGWRERDRGWQEGREEVKEWRGEREKEGKEMKGPEDEKTGKGGRRGSGKINWTILKEGREMFRAKLRDRETCDEATGREKRMGYVLTHTHTHTHTHTPQIASLGCQCISGGSLVLV